MSQLDHRSAEEIATGGMTGGDRMSVHGYAQHYARALRPLLAADGTSGPVLCEVGILRGTGLAVWCDLFPKGRIVGLDIDLSHAKDNIPWLKSRGAFKQIEPELHLFDQLMPDEQLLHQLFCRARVSICIDDGLHSNDAILQTFTAMKKYLSKDFIYFIEDSITAKDLISNAFPSLKATSFEQLTIITPK
ncbi:MAG: hypothetical protein WD688_02040 [Candidatus Binatia bacterium]